MLGCNGGGDRLNTTDDELSTRFNTLSIHSPNSPSFGRFNHCTNSHLVGDTKISSNQRLNDSAITQDGVPTSSNAANAETFGTSAAVPLSQCHTPCKTVKAAQECNSPRRTMLECVLPRIAPWMDAIRNFWPFGRGMCWLIRLAHCKYTY